MKRSVRAAVVVPGVFAVAHFGFSNPQVGLFAAFGSFALLLLVDFTGRPKTRFLSLLVLVAVAGGFVALGTAVSLHKVAAVATMAVVAFLVLFAGIVIPQAATGATAALLTFVLPVAVAAPSSQIGPRLLGFLLAAAVCVAACMLIWPTPWHDNLRRSLYAAVTAVAKVAQAHARGVSDPADHQAMVDDLARLRAQFRATPYPPTSAAANAVALSKLVGRVEWVATNVALNAHEIDTLTPDVTAVLRAAAVTLERSADLICDGAGHPVDDDAVVTKLQDSVARLGASMDLEIETDLSDMIEQPEVLDGAPGEFAAALDPGFHARALGTATEMVADATLAAAGIKTPVDRRLGHGRVDAELRLQALLAPLPALRLVPQQRAGCRRSRPGRGGGRGHERLPRLLGRARHLVGPAEQCAGDRGHGAAGHRRDGRRLSHRIGHHVGGLGSPGVAVVPPPGGGAGLGCGPDDDFVRRRSGWLHRRGRDPVQHH